MKMDRFDFDHLTRAVAVSSRRRVVAALGTALAAALLGVQTEPETYAKAKHTKRHRANQSDTHQRHRHGSRDVQASRKKRKHRGSGGKTCVPQCEATKPCGDDGCSGSCGTCAVDETCQNGTCNCRPDCTGKTCGSDGCGGSCGGCAANEACQGGSCVCQSQCDGKTCGPDGCGGSCGTCGANELCDAGSCLCQPDCGSKVCGGDGCGGNCGECRDQGAATCGSTGACSGDHCEQYASGTTCQAAICADETTLQPACTCDGQGSCSCPGPLTCANHVQCRSGACLNECGNDQDCAAGYICSNHACVIKTTTPGCDCSNLNFCSGHGVCTAKCICKCTDGYSGEKCSVPPVVSCSDFAGCADCQAQAPAGCVFCALTTDFVSGGVCTTPRQCLSAQIVCPANP
jgi:hypothetical protein